MTKKVMKLGTEAGRSVSSVPFHDETRWRELLRELGGLQKASRIAGVSDDQIGRWRDGVVKAPFSGVALLCDAVGFSMDWLATGEGPQRRAAASEPPRHDAGLMRLAMKFAALADESNAMPPGFDREGYATALYERIAGLKPPPG